MNPKCLPGPSLAKARSRSEDPRLRSLAPHLQAVARKVWRKTGCRVEVDELAAAGWMAVALTMDAHDPAIAPFERYACQRARWAMYDAVRYATRRVSPERGAPEWAADSVFNGQRRLGQLDPSDPMVDSQLHDDRPSGRIEPRGDVSDLAVARDSPEHEMAEQRRAHRVRAAVARLPPRERSVVERHYFDGHRFNHIARDMSISPHAVSRAHRRAIGRLERELAADFEAA